MKRFLWLLMALGMTSVLLLAACVPVVEEGPEKVEILF